MISILSTAVKHCLQSCPQQLASWDMDKVSRLLELLLGEMEAPL
jgi:hypothetical protein